ncbi:MAG: hypothetical protein LN410_01875 [Candidatus Thermoplasmatota archaeon]|nr:hypothetical protein [Candidatus Thermoplasmatota archaeon]
MAICEISVVGLREATKATELLAVHRVSPMHYNTFAAIEQDPQAIRASVSEKTRSEVVVLAPGETHGLKSQS